MEESFRLNCKEEGFEVHLLEPRDSFLACAARRGIKHSATTRDNSCREASQAFLQALQVRTLKANICTNALLDRIDKTG